MMEQSSKIKKIFSGIRDLIKFYWFAPQFLRGFSKLRIINTLLRSTMLDSRLNALVLANINQNIIHTIEMGIFINNNLYLYNNKLCNVYYLFSNIFLLIFIQIK